MSHKFADLAFTQTVRDYQSEMGSREGYKSMDSGEDYNHLMSLVEAEFIMARDSFYMASVSETGWPYVQHRGGPAGFVKVIDAQTIGFSDYAGNRQYVSAGNFRTDDRVSLFFMDYPNRRRLKILGRVEQVDGSDLETMAALEDDDFRAPVERAFVIRIEAFDWNCPKYITPRYTDTDIESLIAPLRQEIKTLSASKGESVKSHPAAPLTAIGNGPLALTITAIRAESEGVLSFELRRPDGTKLPIIEAGAHIQVPVMLDNGKTIWRFYSLASDPTQQDYFTIAVLHQPTESGGRGGSVALHSLYRVGMTLHCYRPDNYFGLQSSLHVLGAKAVFLAGGIGITPIRSMIYAALASGYQAEVHYGAKSPQTAAFMAELSGLPLPLKAYYSDDGHFIDLKSLFSQADTETVYYLCGPPPMLKAARQAAKDANLPADKLVFEAFEE